MASYPKRLIEVDLPIKRISAHARREKSTRQGHISSLHIWWARRPLAACRAVICASLWPDPADELCPLAFRERAGECLKSFAQKVVSDAKLAESCHPETFSKWVQVAKPECSYKPHDLGNMNALRFHLLDFIADFANWDNSTVPEYLELSRAITKAAHEALGGIPGTKPLVVDPFAGGGSIPLEALRVGANAFASDLNPVAVTLNKVALEYIPKYGSKLAEEVRKCANLIMHEARKELARFYPPDPDGAIPVAYLWARTVRCEGPGCGAEIPLVRSSWLARKGKRSIALTLTGNATAHAVDVDVSEDVDPKRAGNGTIRQGSVTCPCCGYTTRVESVRKQLRERNGGAKSARLLAVALQRPGEQGKHYRKPSEEDTRAVTLAAEQLKNLERQSQEPLSLVPDEELDIRAIRINFCMLYGITTFGDMYSDRQALALATLAQHMRACSGLSNLEPGLAEGVLVCLSLAVSRAADRLSSLCRWIPQNEAVGYTFGRQALPMIWDFVELCPLNAGAVWDGVVQSICDVIDAQAAIGNTVGTAQQASATASPLPEDSVDALVTDPPYYDSIPYAYLSDFFYVWIRRTLGNRQGHVSTDRVTPKDVEIVVDRPHALSNSHKTLAFYEQQLAEAFSESRRITRPDGIGIVVFASKTTSSWESILQAILDSGWVITGSWPVDTERPGRLRAQESAALASSIHLVCRPRENPDGSIQADRIGDWRDVLQALPVRMHEWMPRLAREGVVGADAIFACLGPALEIFSRYSRVEKASGDEVALREYLEEVWAAVSREALNMIFEDADASGFEEDARITAMWLWTLSTEANGNGAENGTNGKLADPDDAADGDDDESGSAKAATGYSLEFDAARKIAQGLGVHLERLDSVVEVTGETARLLPVSERAAKLFGKDQLSTAKKTSKRSDQLRLDGMLDIEQESDVSVGLMAVKSGETTLDRIHQSMLLFSAGRSEALQRFLVEDGIGRDQRVWKLAQALSALYPKDSDEKRWVDGVLARKKGLGF